MAKRKELWIAVAWRQEPTSGCPTIEKLVMHFRRCALRDAASDAADSLRYGDTTTWNADSARALHDVTGATLYFEECYSGGDVEVAWQRNMDEPTRGEWYGIRLESGTIRAQSARLVSALAKLGDSASPEDAIAALKAKPARYLSSVSRYIPADISADLAVPKAVAEAA